MWIRDRRNGKYSPGDKLPSENKLAGEFQVPRSDAVSYTHLDVYKRQPEGGAPGEQLFKQVDPDARILPIGVELPGDLLVGVHTAQGLDVYKRQTLR